MATPAIHTAVVSAHSSRVAYATIGFAIRNLSDLLGSYDESAGPERRKAMLNDGLAAQVQFTRVFQGTGWEDCTLDLRFANIPGRNRSIALLATAKAETAAQAARRAHDLRGHIAATFPSRLFPMSLIDAGAPGDAELRRFLGSDWMESQASDLRLFEYIPHESVERLSMGDAYVVYPVQGEEDSLLRPFQLLATSDTPTVLSMCVRPTLLTQVERERLAYAASVCRENEKREEQLIGRTGTIVDVQAGRLADLFEHHLRALQDPLWLRVSVAFCGQPNAGLLASLAADVSHDVASDGEPRIWNKRGEFVEARGGERTGAWFNLARAETADWLPRKAEPASGLERLRHLVSPEAACAAVRVPMPSIGGLPGIDQLPPNLFIPLPEALREGGSHEPTVAVGDARLPLLVLTRHVLASGTIGSGKTNTIFQLLYQISRQHKVPFLVIEPVNAEHDDYRALGRFLRIPEELRIFTVGDDKTSALRLNPFHIPPGVILQTHVSGLLACFVAALPFGDDSPLPALFREAIRHIYFARGWAMDDRGGERSDVETPTLAHLRDELAWLIEQRYGHGTETAQTMVGASVTRVNALINSAAGSVLMAPHSIPLDELFEKPTILELRHLGSDEDKRLMTGILLLFLQEYCDRNRATHPRRLNHVVVLEEAHNLMQHVEDPNSPKASAVKQFTNMLAENRKYGQAFIVVEQIPTLLAEGALKNTVTKVMHRLPGKDDVEHMGATMNFKERHQQRAASLQTGEAFLHTEGLIEATLVQVMEEVSKDQPLTDAEVAAAMRRFQQGHPRVFAPEHPFDGCAHCRRPCTYRNSMTRYAYDRRLGSAVMAAYDAANPKEWKAAVAALTTPIRAAAAMRWSSEDVSDATYCLFLHLREQHSRLANISNLGRFHAALHGEE